MTKNAVISIKKHQKRGVFAPLFMTYTLYNCDCQTIPDAVSAITFPFSRLISPLVFKSAITLLAAATLGAYIKTVLFSKLYLNSVNAFSLMITLIVLLPESTI